MSSRAAPQKPSLLLLLLKHGIVQSMTMTLTKLLISQCPPLKPRLLIVWCITPARCSQAQLNLTYALCQRQRRWIRIPCHRTPTLIQGLETTNSSRKIWISTRQGFTRLKLLGRYLKTLLTTSFLRWFSLTLVQPQRYHWCRIMSSTKWPIRSGVLPNPSNGK